MKALNSDQLKIYVEEIRHQILGAQLQDVTTDGECLDFKFYLHAEFHLFMDLRPVTPALVFLPGPLPFRFSKRPKPLSLFLKAHAVNLKLVSVDVLAAKGRVVEFEFANAAKNCRLELILVPRTTNLLADTGEKKISWSKPRPLPPPREFQTEAQDSHSWKAAEWTQQYIQTRLSAAPQAQSRAPVRSGPGPRLGSASASLEKKKMAIQKLQQSLQKLSTEAQRYRALGEALKISPEAPPEFADLFDPRESAKENREAAFQKAKSFKQKEQRTLERLAALNAEIEKKSNADQESAVEAPGPGSAEQPKTATWATQILQKADSRGRTLSLDSNLQAVIGKSAKDNLAILRHARAWDLWMHLKDEPSAHAIIFRNRNQVVARDNIDRVARWLFEQTARKRPRMEGLKFDIVVVECRFVRPMKGDRLGRVTYHSPTTYTVAC